MSPPYISYYLAFNTGSQFTWTQCKKCKERGRSYFNRREPIFPNTKSSSNRPVLCNDQHHLCDPRRYSGIFCEYRRIHGWFLHYLTHGLGNLHIRFELQWSWGQRNCSDIVWLQTGSEGFLTDHPNNLMAGVMGIGWGPPSIITQLQTQANGHFSYCIPMVGNSGLVPSTPVRGRYTIKAGVSDNETAKLRH
ncbi:Xylanase inhibitor, N-terminal [Parasponia andersonii]|uniref:Xylanase inhibitor, N-terminal n=1 Tax=Parasponia andersonii TaxID=3476 RepID=A0A2P5C847_PARAD|nr:Xylanase inhibitor, N-terminal [Parasponia andersonii]